MRQNTELQTAVASIVAVDTSVPIVLKDFLLKRNQGNAQYLVPLVTLLRHFVHVDEIEVLDAPLVVGLVSFVRSTDGERNAMRHKNILPPCRGACIHDPRSMAEVRHGMRGVVIVTHVAVALVLFHVEKLRGRLIFQKR